jgi:hypothetical protein
MKIKLLTGMAGDHGNHQPGKEVDVPVNVARQLIHRNHATAIDPLPDPTEDEVFPEDMKPVGKGKRKTPAIEGGEAR